MGCITSKRETIYSNQLKKPGEQDSQLKRYPHSSFSVNQLNVNQHLESLQFLQQPNDEIVKSRLNKSFLFTNKKHFYADTLVEVNPNEDNYKHKSKSNKYFSQIQRPSLLSNNLLVNSDQSLQANKNNIVITCKSPLNPRKESNRLFEIISNEDTSPKVCRKIEINPYNNFNTIRKFFVYQLRSILLHSKKCQNEQNSPSEVKDNAHLSYYEVFANYSNIAALEANTYKKFDDKNIQINDYYIYKNKVLGRGAESYVYLCLHIKKNMLYAVKVRSKKRKDTNEVNILKRLHSKYIVAVYEVIETKSEEYIIMELMKNNSLGFNLMSLDIFCIWKYFRNLVSAIEHCHEIAKVVHLNISLTHCLIDDDDLLKLSNFSEGQIIEDNQPIRLNKEAIMPLLTVYPPEVAFSTENNEYDGKAIDIWMLGNLLYLLVFGHNFVRNNGRSIEDYSTEGIALEQSDLNDLLCCLLERLPEKRYTIDEIKKSKWVTTNSEFPMPDLHEEALEYCYYLTSKEMHEQSLFK